MASGIAHDFNNALSTIRGFTELLLRNEDKRSDDDSLKYYLGVIENAANNAAETVRRMRKFYKPSEDAELHRLNVNTVIDKSISITRLRWQLEAQAQGECITLEKGLSPVPPINGNEAEPHEMMTNLIFNAVDAMEREGTIIIGAGVEDEGVVIEVRDTGMGMDDEVYPRFMKPFFSRKGMLSILTHNVHLADNGYAALQMLGKKKYDLLITDRAMPGMSGDALAQRAKEIAPDLPVIVITGFGDIMEANSDKPEHVRTVLSKPMSLGTLRSAISEHMDE